ncbi:MAG: amino acid racemase [Acidobacteriota bacterium]
MTTHAIIGGMGPLASAAFLQTIYENHGWDREQELPDILLHSLSSVPDRTSTLLSGRDDLLLERLRCALRQVNLLDPASIVICCVTSHHLLDRLPEEILPKIISLTDTALKTVAAKGERALLLATRATYELRVFERSRHYAAAAPLIVTPEPADQERVHAMIYDDLKKGRRIAETADALAAMTARYGVGAFIAGCTEFHLVTRHLRKNRVATPSFIDPLMTIADKEMRA